MLDIKLIREAPDVVENDLKRRGDTQKLKLLEDLIRFDRERRELIQKVDALRKERNEITEHISKQKSEGKNVSSLLEKAKEIPQEIKKHDVELENLNDMCRNILMKLPNILHSSVPIGKDDADNQEIRRWGEKEWGFEPKNHTDLLEKLGLLDGERAAKVAGHGFFYLKGKLAILDFAVMKFALDFLANRGFVVVEPPFMLSRKPYEGVTDLGDFENVMYKVEGEDLYMIATSEHPIGAMLSDEVVLQENMPLMFAGISPCFRKEVGAHGKYTRGLFRMHHFNKIEQFVFCLPKDSWRIHEELQNNSELMMQALEIPYRVVNVCSGDIGNIAAKKYDIEFLMADGKYREIGSNSNCTDYQARRLNIKYREKEGVAPAGFVHTLNNTGLATSRAMIAIIENNQREDGTIDVPKALQSYTGFKRIE